MTPQITKQTQKKGYQEIMFFDWKIQLEKVQLTRDLSDNTMIYQGIRLPCENDQLFGFPRIHAQHFKYQKYTLE